MNLENIGFYTLEDKRAKSASDKSPLWRCEMILTDSCNFKCRYCRQMKYRGNLDFELAMKILQLWRSHGLKNIRYSGGEPTLYKELPDLIWHSNNLGIQRIAISTNGSAHFDYYKKLIDSGVNDISISLDACCASIFDTMTKTNGHFQRVISNIKRLSELTYVTVGLVYDSKNHDELNKIIEFIYKRGVSDIRIIPTAQYDKSLAKSISIDDYILIPHPILKYRINNLIDGRDVRGLCPSDNDKCPLVLDDMVVAQGYHFPCIIYFREHGNPIGKIGENMRQERLNWYHNHSCHADPICSKNCLDVCVDYNNKYKEFHKGD